jgi:hypothetical protein
VIGAAIRSLFAADGFGALRRGEYGWTFVRRRVVILARAVAHEAVGHVVGNSRAGLDGTLVVKGARGRVVWPGRLRSARATNNGRDRFRDRLILSTEPISPQTLRRAR